ncbi:MAG: pyridoxal-phosphate dependent enzyme [Candidatus Sumerlaeaceae bacterium]|nr:pyridoxal-phosphate dependent enzyme [Candidatus Sumerlaeaceae bacterium]
MKLRRARLVGLRSGKEYDLARLEEWGEGGETLDLQPVGEWSPVRHRGTSIYERFRDFWYLPVEPQQCSLGEGHTPLIKAPPALKHYTGLDRLYLKNETANPTWSFKDRGTVACCALARQYGENYLATVSTGNMGQSVAAYAARCGMKALIITPATAAKEKLCSASLYGATILQVATDDLCRLKHEISPLATKHGLRITSGANPFRVEGYKFESFEMWEQLEGIVPDFIAVPTSAGGHIRGIFKGWQELEASGFVESLPTMVLVQPAENAPLAAALSADLPEPITFPPARTLASALTSNDPPGGTDLLNIAKYYGWLASDVSEDGIREGWHVASRSGLWLEPSSAIIFPALKQLTAHGKLPREATVVAVMTGAGPKDNTVLKGATEDLEKVPLEDLETRIARFMANW